MRAFLTCQPSCEGHTQAELVQASSQEGENFLVAISLQELHVCCYTARCVTVRRFFASIESSNQTKLLLLLLLVAGNSLPTTHTPPRLVPSSFSCLFCGYFHCRCRGQHSIQDETKSCSLLEAAEESRWWSFSLSLFVFCVDFFVLFPHTHHHYLLACLTISPPNFSGIVVDGRLYQVGVVLAVGF